MICLAHLFVLTHQNTYAQVQAPKTISNSLMWIYGAIWHIQTSAAAAEKRGGIQTFCLIDQRDVYRPFPT